MLVLSVLPLVFLVGGTSASFQHFGIPSSNAIVNVRVFNVGNFTLFNEAPAVIAPVVPGHETLTVPTFSFLVEHNTTQKRILWDMGIRKDTQNAVPLYAEGFAAGFIAVEQTGDIASQLEAGGIPLTSIESVIWSHAHFDHIGDMSTFPNTTGLVFGADTNTSTFPEFPNATLQASDLTGHIITKIDFSHANLTFSGLKAIDYFGDGSFYLLDTPGHLAGHMTALARVTPTSFITLGGDTFHHVGEARPRPAFQKNFPCPAHLLEETKTSVSTEFFWSPNSSLGSFDILSRAQQFFSISDHPDSFYADPVISQVSLEKVATFDADPDFFVLVAHDASVVGALPYFPASLNGWKASKLKESTAWSFVDKTNPAFALGTV
ncbi:beta-lactamase-like protein [Mycena rosella]|uniref:Beta-lactamase-like protein n=1 Tax=Mycena rosella TaxID=1033263 RepID=A0AAD7BXW4_MYCRO|nr:beta-lactamase-like protein [Mycena rosella]